MGVVSFDAESRLRRNMRIVCFLRGLRFGCSAAGGSAMQEMVKILNAGGIEISLNAEWKTQKFINEKLRLISSKTI